jgi:hypothetical protein
MNIYMAWAWTGAQTWTWTKTHEWAVNFWFIRLWTIGLKLAHFTTGILVIGLAK